MSIDPNTARFINLITSVQNRLYAYFMAVCGDPDAAGDLVQNTNVILCKKAGEFTPGPGSDFAAWALTIARYEALEYRRQAAKNTLVFDDRVADQIADVAASVTADIDDRVRALHGCLEQLNDRHRAFIDQRYSAGRSVQQIAVSASMTPNAIRQLLHRARQTLTACIEARLGDTDAERGRGGGGA